MPSQISRPLCAINGLSWDYLAYIAPAASLAWTLYVLAALSTASGVPYAVTFLRRMDGALSRRADNLAGPGSGALALTYAFNEKRSIDREKTRNTTELVLRWKWHNEVRTAILTFRDDAEGVGHSTFKLARTLEPGRSYPSHKMAMLVQYARVL